jgi:hypothetical protein
MHVVATMTYLCLIVNLFDDGVPTTPHTQAQMRYGGISWVIPHLKGHALIGWTPTCHIMNHARLQVGQGRWTGQDEDNAEGTF